MPSDSDSETALAKVSIVIGGVMADASEDANGDGETNGCDEYVRITNTGREPVDLSQFQILDSVGVRHVFAPATTIRPNASWKILTSELNERRGSCSIGVWNNTGDEIILRDGWGAIVDKQTYFQAEKGLEIVFYPE